MNKRLQDYIEAELVEVPTELDEIKSWQDSKQEAFLGDTYWAIKDELNYE